MTRRSSASRSTRKAGKPAPKWTLWIVGVVVIAGVVIPAFLASRPPALPPSAKARSVRPNTAAPAGDQSPRVPSAQSEPPKPDSPPTRTRATEAWNFSQGANPQEAATKIHALLRAETDDRVKCEIIGAASTIDANPALHKLFEESSDASQSSRVRQVALDLWLTVYPDEAPTIARRFLTDADEEVRSIAEEYFQTKREEAKQR